MEDIVHQVVKPGDLNTIVSNIGVMPDLSALFTPNSGMHTAFVQVGLKEDHNTSSFVYMDEVRRRDRGTTSASCAPTFSPAASWMQC